MTPALEHLFLYIGSHFTSGAYLIATKIEGVLWSAADLVLVFFFLKICDHVRRCAGRPGILWRYVLLGLSALLTVFLPFSRSPRQFFALEVAICGIQYGILLVALALDGKATGVFFERLLRARSGRENGNPTAPLRRGSRVSPEDDPAGTPL